MTERKQWAEFLRRFSIPFTEGERDGRKTIELEVPDAGVGRVTHEHPGCLITLMFVRDRFAGLVNRAPSPK